MNPGYGALVGSYSRSSSVFAVTVFAVAVALLVGEGAADVESSMFSSNGLRNDDSMW